MKQYFVITGIEKCKEPDEIFAHCEKAIEHIDFNIFRMATRKNKRFDFLNFFI